MSTRFTRLIAIVGITAPLSACVGVEVISGTKYHLPTFIGTSVGTGGHEGNIKADLLRVWGAPKGTYSRDGKEYWVYNESIAWRGIIAAIVVIPIPLVLPVGHNETTVELDGDVITSLWNERAIDRGGWFGCSIGSDILPPGGCHWGK